MVARKRHFIIHWSRRLSLILLTIILLTAASVAPLQYSLKLRTWVQSQMIEYTLRELKPHLPFTIEKIDVQESWNEFFKGRLSNLSFRLKWGEWRIYLSGSLSAKRDVARHEIAFDYSPTLYVEPAALKNPSQFRSPQVTVDLSARVAYEFTQFSKLEELQLDSNPKQFKWDYLHLNIDQPEVNAYWIAQGASGNAVVNLDAAAVAYDGNHNVNVSGIHFHGQSDLAFKPFHYGPKIAFKLSAQSGEILWGERYFSLPLKSLPMQALVMAPGEAAAPWLASLDVGEARSKTLSLNAKLTSIDTASEEFTAHWSSGKLPIKKLIAAGATATANDTTGFASFFAKISEIDIARGTIQTSGEIKYRKNSTPIVDAFFDIDHLSFEWPENYLAIDDIHLKLPISNSAPTTGSIQVEQILYRKVVASLQPTQIKISPQDESKLHFNFFLGAGDQLPIRISQFPLEVGAFKGQVHLPDESEKDFHYELASSAHLPRYAVERVIPPLCLKVGKLPPATVQLDFPTIDINPFSVEPHGSLQASLFEGKIEMKNIGFYDLKSEVSETDFDLDVDHLRLDELGDYLGFGEMDGFLHAYAHDVTLQNALPTHYDFKLELLRNHSAEVVFSTEAMQNLLPLVGADGILKMGGFGGSFARWLGFGLPRKLLGGYNVLFAGISLFSDEGKILLETLEPPLDMDPTRRAKYFKNHKDDHFVLYGVDWVLGIPTFKIQLQTAGYPVILDATSVSNYVYRQLDHFNKLSDAKKKMPSAKTKNIKGIKEKENENETRIDLNCEPPRLSHSHLH